MMKDLVFGFRIVGALWDPRWLVDAVAAFSGYATCDGRAEVHREAYLSAFQFGEDFRRQLEETGSTAKYSGPCWSPWLWFDLDNEHLETAHSDAVKLTSFLVERFALSPDALLIFFSGSKGFHLGLPTALWSPEPSATFHMVCRRFAENVAIMAAVIIDAGVYDKVRAFRAPNSRHPKTGLHKRQLSHDELTGLPLEKIVELAKTPTPFDVPPTPTTNPQAVADWQTAMTEAARQGEVKAARRAAVGQREFSDAPALNRGTLAFIREGAAAGDRHRLLFSAAANLADFHCPPALAVALLEESALDSGLLPKDVRRQIECGLAAVPSPLLPPPPKIDQGEPVSAVLPPLPPALIPLPPGAVGSGTLDKPCKCGSTEYVELPLSEGRTRRDCRKCGRFLGWGRWYDQGGPTS